MADIKDRAIYTNKRKSKRIAIKTIAEQIGVDVLGISAYEHFKINAISQTHIDLYKQFIDEYGVDTNAPKGI